MELVSGAMPQWKKCHFVNKGRQSVLAHRTRWLDSPSNCHRKVNHAHCKGHGKVELMSPEEHTTPSSYIDRRFQGDLETEYGYGGLQTVHHTRLDVLIAREKHHPLRGHTKNELK